jgi:hypothetical protein
MEDWKNKTPSLCLGRQLIFSLLEMQLMVVITYPSAYSSLKINIKRVSVQPSAVGF